MAKTDALPIYQLQINTKHIEIVESLPFIHRDPFDRIMIAAAKVENMAILTVDENIHKYDVLTLW